MRHSLIALLLSLAVLELAKAEVPDLLFDENGKVLSLSKSCPKKKSCRSKEVMNLKNSEIVAPKAVLSGHEAAHFCVGLKGKNYIYSDAKKEQYDICVFKDGSMVPSWTLYTKYFPVIVSKEPPK